MKVYYISFTDGNGNDCSALAVADSPETALRIHMDAKSLDPWDFMGGVADVWTIPTNISGATALHWHELEHVVLPADGVKP